MADIHLDIWDGDWGLPSVDHRCLAVMAYCKFAEVSVTLHNVNNPYKSKTGELPVLRQDDSTVCDIVSIFNHLRKNNLGSDFDLSARQSADIVAFTALLEEKLLPALLHLWWTDSKTFVDLTRPWVAKRLPFPYGLFLPNKLQKEVNNRLHCCAGGDHMTDSDRESKILKNAKECLNLLSRKLGENDYFISKRPTSFDAIVFGYLAPLMKIPFNNTQLQNHLKGCPNLEAFCKHILNTYFPLKPKEAEDLKKKAEEDEKSRRESSMDFPHRRRNMLIGGAVALTTMIVYAFLSGIIQIQITDADDEEDDLEGSSTDPPHIHDYFDDEEENEGEEDE